MADEETQKPEEQATRSPFAGCLILIVMGLVILVLISSAAYFLKKQTSSFVEFTEEEAKPTPILKLEGREQAVNSLSNRLRHFAHEIENKRAAEIELSAEDLNLAVAQFDDLKNFRGQLSIESITPDLISGQIHFPLSSTKELPEFVCSLLSIERRDNNINGTFTAKPLLTSGKLIFNLETLTPSKGEMPEAFFEGISRIMISGELKEEDALQLQLNKLTGASLKDGFFVLAYSPEATPPDALIESDKLADKAKQFAALGAVILILSMILLFIILSRRRKAKRAGN